MHTQDKLFNEWVVNSCTDQQHLSTGCERKSIMKGKTCLIPPPGSHTQKGGA